jgi:folate-dependent phosphoribosylglycinamide formyltransferase PurN
MIRTILLSLTLAGAMALAADRSSGDEAAVRAAVTQFNTAAKAGDEATLKKIISDDLMYSHSNAKVETKAECVAALVKSKPDFVLTDGWTVQVYGKSALVHGKMVAHNGATQTALHFMMMWVKDGSTWKMVGRHTARLPA